MFEFISDLHSGEYADISGADRVILLRDRSVFLTDGENETVFPMWQDVSDFISGKTFLPMIGNLDGERVFAAELDHVPETAGKLREFPLRQFLFEYPEDYRMALCRARNLLHWRQQHRYCGSCRALLKPSENDSGLRCPECGNVYYPQLSPVVIVAVTRNGGRELLLAHNRNFAGNMYSLIAGFVESGESVEAAIHREIREECSIRVKNLQYISSQMWPFPNSLMLAFTAEYDSGIAVPDGGELSDLGWFTAENHPELPANGSIARLLIDRIFS